MERWKLKKEKLVPTVVLFWECSTRIKKVYPAANSWHTYIESRPVNSNIRSARLLRDFDRLVSIIQRMRSNMYGNQHYGDRHTIGASIAKHNRYNGLIASELTNNITRAHKLILYLHNGASSADILSRLLYCVSSIFIYTSSISFRSIENNEEDPAFRSRINSHHPFHPIISSLPTYLPT